MVRRGGLVLLAADAAVNATDKYGLIPYDLAESGGYSDVTAILARRSSGGQNPRVESDAAGYANGAATELRVMSASDDEVPQRAPTYVPRVRPHHVHTFSATVCAVPETALLCVAAYTG